MELLLKELNDNLNLKNNHLTMTKDEYINNITLN